VFWFQWPIRISILDWQPRGKHRVIGQVETTFRAIQDHVAIRGNADRELAFEVIGCGDDGQQQYHHREMTTAVVGLLVVLKADIIPAPSR